MIEVTESKLLEQALLSTNLDHIQDMIDTVVRIVMDKNRQYGDAWQLYGVLTPLLRIKENMFRVEGMADGARKVIYNPEVKKRLVDIAGYALLGLAWLNSPEGLELLSRLDMERATSDTQEVVDQLRMDWRMDGVDAVTGPLEKFGGKFVQYLGGDPMIQMTLLLDCDEEAANRILNHCQAYANATGRGAVRTDPDNPVVQGTALAPVDDAGQTVFQTGVVMPQEGDNE